MNGLAPADDNLARRIGHIAGVLSSSDFPTGDRAELRRMSPYTMPPMAFYKFALRHLPETWEARPRDWITLVAGMTIMYPAIHRPDRGLGIALAEARYSEARLERLLASEGDTRRSLVLRMARFAAAKQSPFNWTDVAWLLLITDPESRERLHRRVARDFYLNLSQGE